MPFELETGCLALSYVLVIWPARGLQEKQSEWHLYLWQPHSTKNDLRFLHDPELFETELASWFSEIEVPQSRPPYLKAVLSTSKPSSVPVSLSGLEGEIRDTPTVGMVLVTFWLGT